MLGTLVSAAGVFIATSIDYLFILLIIFAQTHHPEKKKQILAGQYLGTSILITISLIAAYLLNFIPEEWIIGLLGFIPIYLGIRFVVKNEGEMEEEVIRETMQSREGTRLFWVVSLLTLSFGGDNIATYIPYFALLNWHQIGLTLLVFAAGVFLLGEVSYRLSTISFISKTIETYEHIIVPIVFVLHGIYILVEKGTIQHFMSFL